MGVPSLITDLSSTAASNSPAGGDSIGTTLDDYIRALSAFIHQLYNTSIIWAGTSTGTNTITATASPAPTAYVTGQGYAFLAGGANTGAATLNLNSLGAKSITKDGTTALASGDIPSGTVAVVIYDGTEFQLINPAISGTVTSVALTVPAEFSVSGSPITGSGTLAVSKANQSANIVFAGPSSGGAAAPTFRALVSADLPAVNVYNHLTASPTGTTSSTGVMMGLAGAITPAGSGAIEVSITGYMLNSAAHSNTIQIRYGTGSAPANGAAATGTLLGGVQLIGCGAVSGGGGIPIALNGILSGLTLSTAYWVDVLLTSVDNTSTASISQVNVSIKEIK